MDVCSSALLIPAILGCGRTDPPLKPLSEFAEPALYIDVAVRQGGDYTYYEIKTGLSAQSCIREALGQLLEYSYWPGGQSAAQLVIVGEPPLDDNARDYLETLRVRFSLPVKYKQFDMDSTCLV